MTKTEKLKILLGTIKILADEANEIMESDLELLERLWIVKTELSVISNKLKGLEKYSTITPDELYQKPTLTKGAEDGNK